MKFCFKKKNTKKDNKNSNIKEHEVLNLGDIVNSSRSQPTGSKHEKESSVFLTENDDIELQRQKDDVLRKQHELELKLKQQDEELKKKDAIERAKRQQQAIKEEEKARMLENENARKQKEEIKHQSQQEHSPTSHELNEQKEKERKKREKENLEEDERKKRWISQSTVNTVDESLDKNSVDKAKKEELLAKLNMFNTNDARKNDTTSEETSKASYKPFGNEISNHQNHTVDSVSTHTKTNSSSNASKSNNNDIVFNFATANSNTNSSLPPKPLNQQKPHPQANSNEYKHSLEVENLHEGKPVNFSRDSNKNELLNKLFGDSSTSQGVNSYKQQPQIHQSKLDKVDDIFVKTSPPVSSKVNLLPWEIQDINFNTNNSNSVRRENSNAKSNAGINGSNNSKQDHLDFFSKLNSKNETINNGFKSTSSTNQANGMNRPKLENRINFSPNNRNNYVEDIEELTL